MSADNSRSRRDDWWKGSCLNAIRTCTLNAEQMNTRTHVIVFPGEVLLLVTS